MAMGYQYISATAPRKKMAEKIIRIRSELIVSSILLLKFRFNSAYVSTSHFFQLLLNCNIHTGNNSNSSNNDSGSISHSNIFPVLHQSR